MPLSFYALDNFVAPKLSQLTTCGAQPLPETGNLLDAFILNNLLNGRFGNGEARARVFNLVRRLDQAAFEYEQGRADLRRKVEERPPNHIELYFRALAHFEQCLASLYQFAMFWRVTTPDGKMFKAGDGSILDLINKIYNISHHMDTEILNGRVPTGITTPVWLLNDGIACDGIVVTFDDLRSELINARNATKKLVGVAESSAPSP